MSREKTGNRKKNGIFLISSLLIVIFWQWAFMHLKFFYSGATEAQWEIQALLRQLERSKVQTEVVQYQFDLFRQHIAASVPVLLQDSGLKDPVRAQARGLASVSQTPQDEFLTLAKFESRIEELKRLFEGGQYKQVISRSKSLMDLNPVSPSMVNVYFMLAESYYQTNEMDASLAMAQKMTQLFPEHDKTGYVLLRVGLFLKEKNRLEEARNMFSLVAQAFAHTKELREQSQKLLAKTGGPE